jgi:hypothetical protein
METNNAQTEIPYNVQEAINDITARCIMHSHVGLGTWYGSIALVVYRNDPERIWPITNCGPLRDECYPHSPFVARVTWVGKDLNESAVRESLERQVRQCLVLIAEQRGAKKRKRTNKSA